MTKMARARQTLKFKREAASLVESVWSIAAPARTLGIVEQTLVNWINASREGKGIGVGSQPVNAEQRVIARLRAEPSRVKIEPGSLEKATAYFAKASKRSTPSLSATDACGQSQCSVLYSSRQIRQS